MPGFQLVRPKTRAMSAPTITTPGSRSSVRLSLIIATYNRADYMTRTLNSLTNQSLGSELFEIIVVNNNSTDHTAEVCRSFAEAQPELNFTMVTEIRQGLSHARNCGINHAKGDYFAIIDDDELVNRDFLKSYYDFFGMYPTVAACGGVVTPLYEFPVPAWLSRYAERPIAGTFYYGEKIVPFPKHTYPGGGNMGIRRTAIERYGMFNPELGRTGNSPMGGEEKDLFARLRAGGEEIYYVPGAIIYHIIPEQKLTPEYFDRLTRMIGKSERVRTRNLGTATYLKRLFSEGIKWGGTFVLALGYTVQGEPIKGRYLIKMRWNISRGLLGLIR